MRGLRIPETNRARALRRDASAAERKLWRSLRGRLLDGHKFVRQEQIGPYYADFACREVKLVVEVDGATHAADEEIAALVAIDSTLWERAAAQMDLTRLNADLK